MVNGKVCVFQFWLAVLMASCATAADCPMWRYDASRSGATSESLPADLQLSWSRDLGPNHIAWSEDVRLQFDACYQPIVAGQTMFVASSRNDTVEAFDTRTGEARWQFFADGPIRLAPVAHAGRIYFGADDGFFYCVDASNGQLIWKADVAMEERRVLGNERLISLWPVRGGAVLVGNQMFFTVGVWPFEGLQTCQFTVSDTGNQVPEFRTSTPNSLSPQGYLVASDGKLFFPGGRAKAGAMETGRPVSLDYEVRGQTDWHVAASGPLLFHGGRIYDNQTRQTYNLEVPRPVATEGWIYTARAIENEQGEVVSYKIFGINSNQRKDRVVTDSEGQPVNRHNLSPAWEYLLELDPASENSEFALGVKAGSRLYGYLGSTIFALELPSGEGSARLAWTKVVDGTPGSLLAADDRLYVVTKEGKIDCFAESLGPAHSWPVARTNLPEPADATKNIVADWVEATGCSAGYGLILGIGSTELVNELLQETELRLIAIDPDPAKVDQLRRYYDAAGLYGKRISAIVADPLKISLPPYLANLIVVQQPEVIFKSGQQGEYRQLYQLLRPYGGALALRHPDGQQVELVRQVARQQLANAEVSALGEWTMVQREGALPGAADWTHEYSDPSNTLMSQDQLVKAPLGILWFGGPASRGEHFHNRHYWPPSLKVCQGRMFIQGPERLTCVDIYTGRVIWSNELVAGSGAGRRGTFFEVEKPGYHYAVGDGGLYLVSNNRCVWLDPATGKELGEFKLPEPNDQWGDVRIWKNLLLTTVFRTTDDRESQPQLILALDRWTGQVVWAREAQYAAPLVALGDDTLFYFDGRMHGFYDAWGRKGEVPEAEPARYLVALDAATGNQKWLNTIDRVVTWLSYSKEHELLIASNKAGMDAVSGTTGETYWTKDNEAPGFGGHPENVWDKVILRDNWVIDQRGPGLAYDIHSGEPITRSHPVSGEPVPWEFTKTGHHCNYAISSPHLLTFRAGTAGFFDIESGGTGRLEGFRSGCRNSLIPAGGILNAPNYAHGCSCSYNLFTSLALVHVPENDFWSYNAFKAPEGTVKRLGINLGAPGHRQDDQGTLWLNYPDTHEPFNGEPSIEANVEVVGKSARWFQLPSKQIEGASLPWVAASGVEGMSSLVVNLPGDAKEKVFEVTLIFVEPDPRQAGERSFDISLQGKFVKQSINIAEAAGGSQKTLVLPVGKVKLTDQLVIQFTPQKGQPLICGVQLVADD
jgi:outer membrane protein assembly factor BamB